MTTKNPEDLKFLILDCNCKIYQDGVRILCHKHALEARRAQRKSWDGRIDRASGASEPYELDPNYHEMGH